MQYDEIVHVIEPCDTRPCDMNVHVTQYFQQNPGQATYRLIFSSRTSFV